MAPRTTLPPWASDMLLLQGTLGPNSVQRDTNDEFRCEGTDHLVNLILEYNHFLPGKEQRYETLRM
jgi:hypothetical protein